MVLILGLKLFAVFVALVVATIGLTYYLEISGGGEPNLAAEALFWLMAPALLTRGWLSNQESYINISSFGIIDIVGLSILYFLLCVVLAWVWTRIRYR